MINNRAELMLKECTIDTTLNHSAKLGGFFLNSIDEQIKPWVY